MNAVHQTTDSVAAKKLSVTAEVKDPSLSECFDYVISYLLAANFPSLLSAPRQCRAVASIVFPSLIALSLHQIWSVEEGQHNAIKIVSVFVFAITSSCLAFLAWAAVETHRNRLEATFPALQALEQGTASHRIVTTERYTLFLPNEVVFDSNNRSNNNHSNNQGNVATSKVIHVKAGCVFLPGALVDHRAYSRVAQNLAARHGILMVIVNSEPTRLVSKVAGFTKDYLESIIHQVESSCHVSVAQWSIGGHSLGADQARQICMEAAASAPQKTPKKSSFVFSTLVMYGMCLPPPQNLQKSPIRILVINATNDGFYFPDEKAKAKYLSRFPFGEQFTYVEIQGGNHGGFADYPPQMFPKPDGSRAISLEEQHHQVVEITAKFLLSAT